MITGENRGIVLEIFSLIQTTYQSFRLNFKWQH